MFAGLSQGFLKKYHGVDGGVLFRSAAAQKLAANNPMFKKMNNGRRLLGCDESTWTSSSQAAAC